MTATIDVNGWAILLAAVAYYVLGAVWFTPLFGRAWDIAVGVPRGETAFTPLYYLAPLVNAVLAALATAVLAAALDIRATSDAFVLGAVVGLGYAVGVSVTNAVTPRTARPVLLGAITAAYHLTGLVVVSLVIVAMR